MKTINELSSARDFEAAKPELGNVLDLRGLPGQGNVLLDQSACGNHGAITGATWGRLSSGLCGLNFGEIDDKIVISHNNSLNIAISCTLIAWIKGTDTGGMILGKFVDTPYRGYAVTINVSAVRAYAYDGTDNALRDSSLTNLNNDTFRLVTVVYNGRTNLDVYIDGSLSNGALTGTIPSSIPNLSTDLYLGFDNFNGALNGHYAGDIYLPRIFNIALGAPAIMRIFQRERHLFGV